MRDKVRDLASHGTHIYIYIYIFIQKYVIEQDPPEGYFLIELNSLKSLIGISFFIFRKKK